MQWRPGCLAMVHAACAEETGQLKQVPHHPERGATKAASTCAHAVEMPSQPIRVPRIFLGGPCMSGKAGQHSNTHHAAHSPPTVLLRICS